MTCSLPPPHTHIPGTQRQRRRPQPWPPPLRHAPQPRRSPNLSPSLTPPVAPCPGPPASVRPPHLAAHRLLAAGLCARPCLVAAAVPAQPLATHSRLRCMGAAVHGMVRPEAGTGLPRPGRAPLLLSPQQRWRLSFNHHECWPRRPCCTKQCGVPGADLAGGSCPKPDSRTVSHGRAHA